MEEETKLAERHRSLYSATEELSKIEGIMSDLHSNIHEERGKAIEEIGRLGQVKQSVQSQMFMLSEAQRRSERMSGGAGAMARGVTSPPLTASYASEFSSKVTSGGNKVSYTSPTTSSSADGIGQSRSRLAPFSTQSAASSSSERVRWVASEGHGSSSSRWGSEGGVTSISHSASAPGFAHVEQKSEGGSDRDRDAAGSDTDYDIEREDGDEVQGYSAGGLHSEISDLRAEMQKLSAQSAAVLRDAESAGSAAKSRNVSTF
jgi:hypothetical protein